MIERLLADTGPIVAILSRRDPSHKIFFDFVRDRKGPLFTCWPVLTEAAWLLRSQQGAVERLLAAVDQDLFEVLDLDSSAVTWMKDFIHRYRNLSAQIADAAIMYLSERHGINAVFTLDRRDFSVYRRSDGTAMRLIPEG